MRANRIYSEEKVTFLDILEPYIHLKIEEIISSSKNKQTTSATEITFNGADVI